MDSHFFFLPISDIGKKVNYKKSIWTTNSIIEILQNEHVLENLWFCFDLICQRPFTLQERRKMLFGFIHSQRNIRTTSVDSWYICAPVLKSVSFSFLWNSKCVQMSCGLILFGLKLASTRSSVIHRFLNHQFFRQKKWSLIWSCVWKTFSSPFYSFITLWHPRD